MRKVIKKEFVFTHSGMRPIGGNIFAFSWQNKKIISTETSLVPKKNNDTMHRFVLFQSSDRQPSQPQGVCCLGAFCLMWS
jgi:hypothetical protein